MANQVMFCTVVALKIHFNSVNCSLFAKNITIKHDTFLNLNYIFLAEINYRSTPREHNLSFYVSKLCT